MTFGDHLGLLNSGAGLTWILDIIQPLGSEPEQTLPVTFDKMERDPT